MERLLDLYPEITGLRQGAFGRSLEMLPSLAQLFGAPSRFEEIDPEFEALEEAFQ